MEKYWKQKNKKRNRKLLLLLFLFLLLGGTLVLAFYPSPTVVPTIPSTPITPTVPVTPSIPVIIPPDQEVWVEVFNTGYSAEQGYTTQDTRTALGTPPTWGTVAVDPEVFPYGTIFYSPKYPCYGVALDTGGMIKGYHVDWWVMTNEEAYALTGTYKIRVLRLGWENWLVNPERWGIK
jgi:3D (Asp-Asp-Asp) domain-containing protein